MANKTKLTSELIDAICERVKVGSFPYIAAQAVGIAKSTFYAWMQRGEKGRKSYRELLDKVREASALARSHAEVRVFRDKPFEWLRYGPGRERPEEPGWTESAQTLKLEGGVQVERRDADEDREVKKTMALAQMVQAMVELNIIPPLTEEGKRFLSPTPLMLDGEKEPLELTQESDRDT